MWVCCESVVVWRIGGRRRICDEAKWWIGLNDVSQGIHQGCNGEEYDVVVGVEMLLNTTGAPLSPEMVPGVEWGKWVINVACANWCEFVYCSS